MKRSCQRHTVTLLLPVWRLIVVVPTPVRRHQHDARSPHMFLRRLWIEIFIGWTIR
jgi:hypothetical protein